MKYNFLFMILFIGCALNIIHPHFPEYSLFIRIGLAGVIGVSLAITRDLKRKDQIIELYRKVTNKYFGWDI